MQRLPQTQVRDKHCLCSTPWLDWMNYFYKNKDTHDLARSLWERLLAYIRIFWCGCSVVRNRLFTTKLNKILFNSMLWKNQIWFTHYTIFFSFINLNIKLSISCSFIDDLLSFLCLLLFFLLFLLVTIIAQFNTHLAKIVQMRFLRFFLTFF